MFFRRKERPDPREGAWRDLAERLELVRLDDADAESLRADLAVDTGRVDALHVLRRDGQPELLIFEHVRSNPPRRGAEERRARVVLRGAETVSEVAWRAFPRSHPLLASLQASSSGGALAPSGDDTFDDAVGVVARDPEPAAALMTVPVRASLLRLLGDDDIPEATVTCGGRHLAWRAHRELEPPFDALESVASRLLAVWAAIDAGR